MRLMRKIINNNNQSHNNSLNTVNVVITINGQEKEMTEIVTAKTFNQIFRKSKFETYKY